MSDSPFVADLKVRNSKAGQPSVMGNGTQLEVHIWPDYKRLLMDFFRVFSDTADTGENYVTWDAPWTSLHAKHFVLKSI